MSQQSDEILISALLGNLGLNVNTERYSNTLISLASVTIVKSSAGFLHAITVAAPSLPTTTFYDNASGASGPVIVTLSPCSPGSYLVNQSWANGLTVNVLPGVTPQLLINKR